MTTTRLCGALLVASFGIAAAMIATTAGARGSASGSWRISQRCFASHNEKTEQVPPHVFLNGFRPAAAYTVDFNDPVPRNVGGAHIIQASNGLVIYATTRAGRMKLEQKYAASIGMSHVPLAVLHLEGHGAAFVQWDPAPFVHSKDRRITTACLGPITA